MAFFQTNYAFYNFCFKLTDDLFQNYICAQWNTSVTEQHYLVCMATVWNVNCQQGNLCEKLMQFLTDWNPILETVDKISLRATTIPVSTVAYHITYTVVTILPMGTVTYITSYTFTLSYTGYYHTSEYCCLSYTVVLAFKITIQPKK